MRGVKFLVSGEAAQIRIQALPGNQMKRGGFGKYAVGVLGVHNNTALDLVFGNQEGVQVWCALGGN